MPDPDTRDLGGKTLGSESRRQLQWLCATLDVLSLELIDAAAADLASHRLCGGATRGGEVMSEIFLPRTVS